MKKFIFTFLFLVTVSNTLISQEEEKQKQCTCARTLYLYGVPVYITVNYSDSDCNPANGGVKNLIVDAYIGNSHIYHGNTGTNAAVAYICGINVYPANKSEEEIAQELGITQ